MAIGLGRTTYAAALAATMSAGLLFGWSIAAINPVLPVLRSAMSLSAVQSGLVVCAVAAGALVGCLSGVKVIDHFGPRHSLIVGGCLSTLGAAASVWTIGPTSMVLSRAVVGAGVGLMSAAAPLFVAARCDAHRRAVSLTAYQLAITAGILVALFIGWVLDEEHFWRAIIGLNAVPAALLAISAAWCSPDGDQLDQGQQSAGRRPAGADNGAVVQQRDRLAHRRATVIAVAAALMNALTGVGLIMYYSTEIFASASPTLAADLSSFVVGAVNLVATIIAVFLVARLRRRTLLTVGLGGMAVSLVVVAVGLSAVHTGGALLAVGGSITYIASFAVSAGPLAWLLVAEFAPPSRGGAVTSAAVASNWICNMVLALVFPIVTGMPPNRDRVAYFCLAFAALSVGFALFIRFRTPETKGLTLDEIQDLLRRH